MPQEPLSQATTTQTTTQTTSPPDITRTAEFERGAALFNAGHWWEAHEAWEAVWLHETGERRQVVQALILLAAALHKRWVHGSLAHRNFYKAEKYLDALPDEYGGVDLRGLRHKVWAALNAPEGEAPRPEVIIQDALNQPK